MARFPTRFPCRGVQSQDPIQWADTDKAGQEGDEAEEAPPAETKETGEK